MPIYLYFYEFVTNISEWNIIAQQFYFLWKNVKIYSNFILILASLNTILTTKGYESIWHQHVAIKKKWHTFI